MGISRIKYSDLLHHVKNLSLHRKLECAARGKSILNPPSRSAKFLHKERWVELVLLCLVRSGTIYRKPDFLYCSLSINQPFNILQSHIYKPRLVNWLTALFLSDCDIPTKDYEQRGIPRKGAGQNEEQWRADTGCMEASPTFNS